MRRLCAQLVPLFLAFGCGASTPPDAEGDDDGGSCDADGDGHDSRICGGDDCDDADSRVNPSVEEDESDSWVTEVVAEVGGAPDLAADTADVAHVVFGTESGSSYANRRDGSWGVEAVAGYGPRVTVSYAGAVHAVWIDAGTLRLGTDADEDGVLEIESPTFEDGASHVVVAVDPADRPHLVCLHQGGLEGAPELRHAVSGPKGWSYEVVEQPDPGLPQAMSIDGAGSAHVALVEWTASSCEVPEGLPRAAYATDATGAWTVEPIESDLVPVYPDGATLTLGSADVARIAMHASTPDASSCFRGPGLRYGLRDASGWALEPREEDADILDVALARDTSGTTHLAFVEFGVGVFYQSDADGAWAPEPVDDAAGSHVSIAASPGFIHLAYDRTGGRWAGIVYARRSLRDGVDNDCDGAVW